MKKLLSLLLALCMVLALAACSGGDSGGETASPSPDSESSATPGLDTSQYDGAKLEIMWQESDATQIDIVQNYAQPAVEAAFPNLEIQWVDSGDADYTAMAQSGELTDIWFGNASPEMIQSGAILDLTPLLTADTYLADNFSNPDYFYFRDHIWALSAGVDSYYTGTMYYNQDVLDEAGIPAITTYDELYMACRQLQDAGYTPITLDGSSNSVFTRFLFQNLIISVDPAACTGILDGGDLNTPAMIQAMTLIADLRNADFLGSGVNTRTSADSIASFVEGESAILYTESWNSSSVGAAEFNVTVGWWPSDNSEHATGEYQANWGSPLSGWTINAETAYPELAVAVVKCIVEAEAARHMSAGLSTNYIQLSAVTPSSDLEAQRAILYAQVGTWYKGFSQNTMDSATTAQIGDQCATLLSDDHYPVADFVAAIQTAWDTNTFFE